MEVSPETTQVGAYVDESFPSEEEEEEDEDLCRICRSPEEPENPLRYPCLCRGSIKYVHQDCLRTWLNRRGYKKCEVCGCSYSFVPIYSENAPERLPCNEFLIGVLLRLARYLKLIVPWIVMILFNTYCVSLHPLGQEFAAEFKTDLGEFAYFPAGLLYSTLLLCFMSTITVMRVDLGDVNVNLNVMRFIGNGGVIGGLVQVLWRHMKILCDWYIHKLVHVLGQPGRPIVLPPDAPLHEFGVIRRLLFFLHDDAFALLAISVYVSVLFFLLPLWIGRVVLAAVGDSYFFGNSPLGLGYRMLLSICFAYVGILFTLHRNLFPAILRWFSLGLHFIALKLPRLLWVFSVKSCKSLQRLVGFGILFILRQTSFLAIVKWFSLELCFITLILPLLLLIVIKYASILCLKIGVLPWIIGCWLEICTFPLFGTSFFQRFEVLSDFPCMTMIRWCSGTICLMVAYSYMKRIQEIVHKRAFWYLLDITDPDYKITKLNLGHTFFVFASHGVLLVILFHLPIRAITLISPSFFPLEFWITDENPSITARSIYINLLQSAPKWLMGLTKPAMELIAQNWIIAVSSWLELSDFLLVVPRREGLHRADQNVRPMMQPRRPYDDKRFLLCSLAEGSMVILHGSQNAEDDIEDKRDNRFLLRIALMLVLAALSLFVVSTAFMALPLLVGRVFFETTSFIMLQFGLKVKRDDLCAFWIGFNILRGIYVRICFVSDQIQKGRIDLLLKDVCLWIRNGLLFSIWISVIPGLLGLLIDLMIIIPLRVPLNESPIFFLLHDWLIGVVVLHIWAFMTMFTPINWFATEAWRRKLERIRNVGIDRLPSMWLLRDVIGSIINTLLTTVSIPYLLVKCLFPLLGYSESVNSAMERLIWPALFALLAVWFMAKLTRDFIVYVHQLVFNERYLVGERLNNLTEEDLEQRI